MNPRFWQRRISLRTAVLACVACTLIAAGGTLAGASSLPAGRPVHPGPPFTITGYGYSCQSTVRTPNFSCDYGKPYGASGTPIMSIYKGSRKMFVQSLRKPAITHSDGEYLTTISR
jgi:hypothetical protein